MSKANLSKEEGPFFEEASREMLSKLSCRQKVRRSFPDDEEDAEPVKDMGTFTIRMRAISAGPESQQAALPEFKAKCV